MASFQSLVYSRGALKVLDQLKLPHEKVFIDVETAEDAWSTIRTMQVRGAPLIAIVAALGLAVHVTKVRGQFGGSAAAAAAFLQEKMTYLRTSRPTAVNLFIATDALAASVAALLAQAGSTADSVVDGFVADAEAILAADVATNRAMGDHGARRILEITGKDTVRVLTICNTGSLATAGYGTALGVVRSLHAQGRLEHVYACETRPYNQGARLTAFEIVEDGLPGTLIADSMASALMAVKGVDCVVVGADRVAANGDTANKIGTYQLAIAAKHHGVPFFAAVPTTTFDLTMASGAEIHVEERPADELTSIFNIKIAPDGIAAWNPAFDVTPCSLIRGVITEVGVAEAGADAGSDGIIDVAAFLRSKGLVERCSKAVAPTAMPTGFVRLDEAGSAAYVARLPSVRRILGVGPADAATLSVHEVGDGNLNFVYIVSGPAGKVVAKQALPYVRCVGESWPLTLKRAMFERNALVAQRALAPEHVPEVYHFDKSKALIIMRYVEPPNLILRKHMIEGTKLPHVAAHVGSFMARTLFGTSLLALDGGSFRSKVSEWSRNAAMCALTEKVIFTDPYTTSDMNHWTTPQLDVYARALTTDVPLQLAVADLKTKFLCDTQALLHGDLHSGSVMASADVSYVIDPEFAYYGPMGFDTGTFVAHWLFAYFAHGAKGDDAYADWLLAQLVAAYSTFSAEFVALWTAAAAAPKPAGELMKGHLLVGPALVPVQAQYMAALWRDTVGFVGVELIRRVVGVAHVADIDSIGDADTRATAEKRVLRLARALILTPPQGLVELFAMAKAEYGATPPAEWV